LERGAPDRLLARVTHGLGAGVDDEGALQRLVVRQLEGDLDLGG
jgi:hypothetical protein